MRRVHAALAAAVMMVVMVSCANESAGGPADPTPGESGAAGLTADSGMVLRAVEATSAVERARVEMQTVYAGLGSRRDVPAGVDEVRVVQRAAFDRRTRQARAESDMSELAAVLETAEESIPGDYSLPTRFLIDGDSVYTQIGPMARVVGLEPTAWIRRDLDGFTDQSIDNETAALLLEPLGMLGLLARPISAVRVVGRDEIRGVATTHLAATVDVSAGSASPAPGGRGGPPAAGSGSPPGGEAGDGPTESNGSPADPDPGGAPSATAGGSDPGVDVEARFHSIGVDELPVDLWIGDDDVVRRLAFTIEAGAAGGPSAVAGRLTTTFEVHAVGEPIDVTVPAAADVVDHADLRARLDP